jgi:tetratricopeptide (TPR) repeat protein
MNFIPDAATEAFNKLVSNGKLAEALPILQQIDIAACEDEVTCRGFLKVASEAGNLEIFSEIASQISPTIKNKLMIILDLALSFVKVGDPERGVHYFLAALEAAPANYWSYYWYAIFKAGRGQPKEALDIIAIGLDRCRGRISPTEWENLQREYFRLLCLSRRDDIKYAQPLTQRAFFTGRAVPNALFVAMVKDEEDIIYECLAAAHKCGLRYFLVANNASTDQTEAEIRRFATMFPDSTVVTIWDPIAGYWQDKKMNAFWRFGVEYLRILGCTIDWIFPVDADEALVQADEHIDLFQVLNSEASEGKKLAVGMWCTATPHAMVEAFDPGQDLNAAFPIVSGYDMAPFTKVSIRVGETASLGMGSHFASGCVEKPADVMCLNEFGIFMLHHPYRTKKQLRSKITNGMKALQAAATLGSQHGGHWRKAYESYAERGELFVEEQLNTHFVNNKRNSDLLLQRAKERNAALTG